MNWEPFRKKPNGEYNIKGNKRGRCVDIFGTSQLLPFTFIYCACLYNAF